MIGDVMRWDRFQAEVLRYAYLYLARGWKVLPCWTVARAGVCTCPLGSQCPQIGEHLVDELVPNGVSDATSDPVKVEEWFGPGTPPRNIAVATRSLKETR